MDSDYQEEAPRSLKSQRRSGPKQSTPKKDSKPKLPENKATHKATSKLKSAAMMAGRFGTHKRSSETSADRSTKMATSHTSRSKSKRSSEDNESSRGSRGGGSVSNRKSPARRAQPASPVMRSNSPHISDTSSQGSKGSGIRTKPRIKRSATMEASQSMGSEDGKSRTVSPRTRRRAMARSKTMSSASKK